MSSIKVIKRFKGSYYINVGNEQVDIQTNIQACRDWSPAREWFVTCTSDFDGDYSGEFKTKRAAEEYARDVVVPYLLSLQ